MVGDILNKFSGRRWAIVILLWLYFGAAVAMSLRLPALATPNELLNYEYVAVMRQIRGLPNRGLVDSQVRYTEWHQPPFYYSFAALVSLGIPVPRSPVNPPPPIEVENNPAYLGTHRGNLNPAVGITPRTFPILYTSRWAAALIGALSLAVLYGVSRRLYGAGVALLITSLLAFQPNFLHLSASVNNDMPLTAVTAVVMAAAAWIIARRKGPPAYLGLGMLVGLALLTKANGAFTVAFIGVALLSQWRHTNWRRAGISALLAGAGMILLWAPWLILNTIRMKDTLGMEGSLPVRQVLLQNPFSFRALLPYSDEVWRSFWLDWSTGQVGYAPDWVYGVAIAALLLGLLGWMKRPWRVRYPFVILAVLGGALGITYLYVAVKAHMVRHADFLVAEGRWMLPAMPGLAWLAGAGFARWWSRRRRFLATTAAAFLWAVGGIALLLWWLPALYPQAQPMAAEQARQNVGITYDGALTLEGVQAPETVTAESPAVVTLDWMAQTDIEIDYLISAQLLAVGSDGWMILDRQNSYPGAGLSPTSTWEAGQVYRDEMVLIPPVGLQGPTQAAVGVWVWDGEAQATPRRDGAVVASPFVAMLTARPAQPLAPPHPLPQPVHFGELGALVDVETAVSDDGLTLTLWWEARQTTAADYVVFAHLVDGEGNLLGQVDGPPNEGYSPTRLWQPGDVIRDERVLAVTPPADGAWRIGLYHPVEGVRLPAVQGDERLADDAFSFPLP